MSTKSCLAKMDYSWGLSATRHINSDLDISETFKAM